MAKKLAEDALRYGYHKRQGLATTDEEIIEKSDKERYDAQKELENAYDVNKESEKVIKPPKREFGKKITNAYTKVGGTLDESLFTPPSKALMESLSGYDTIDQIITAMEMANEIEDLYDAAEEIADASLREEVIEAIEREESEGEDVDTIYSIVTSDLLDPWYGEDNLPDLTGFKEKEELDDGPETVGELADMLADDGAFDELEEGFPVADKASAVADDIGNVADGVGSTAHAVSDTIDDIFGESIQYRIAHEKIQRFNEGLMPVNWKPEPYLENLVVKGHLTPNEKKRLLK